MYNIQIFPNLRSFDMKTIQRQKKQMEKYTTMRMEKFKDIFSRVLLVNDET